MLLNLIQKRAPPFFFNPACWKYPSSHFLCIVLYLNMSWATETCRNEN